MLLKGTEIFPSELGHYNFYYPVLKKLESVETDNRDAPKKEQKIVKASLK